MPQPLGCGRLATTPSPKLVGQGVGQTIQTQGTSFRKGVQGMGAPRESLEGFGSEENHLSISPSGNFPSLVPKSYTKYH
jgi:hypothetical protein